MPRWSDGIERPEWYDGNALTRAIENYFARARDAELDRLRRENADLRATPAPPLTKAMAA